VSAALRFGRLDDAAYSAFDDAELRRLAGACVLRVLPAYDAAYPAAQPACVSVELVDGRVLEQALDDVPWLDDAGVNARFEAAALRHASSASLARVNALLSGLWELQDLSPLFDELAHWR
jgi:2-methylcitrate dehydratase PrpD